jgi:hypothetical protein
MAYLSRDELTPRCCEDIPTLTALSTTPGTRCRVLLLKTSIVNLVGCYLSKGGL